MGQHDLTTALSQSKLCTSVCAVCGWVGSWSRVLSEAVQQLVREHGVLVVVASGNSELDSCTIVPANVPEALTVAASNLDGKFGPQPRGGREPTYRWANTGACVDIFAPGVEIFGACG
ncbi:Proprotein convertase subtilisin/kexin type 9, partial [Tetrabaena socialis]